MNSSNSKTFSYALNIKLNFCKAHLDFCYFCCLLAQTKIKICLIISFFSFPSCHPPKRHKNQLLHLGRPTMNIEMQSNEILGSNMIQKEPSASINSECNEVITEPNILHSDAQEVNLLNVREEPAHDIRVSIESKPTVIDDFVRNFLVRHHMLETLNIFQREWYNMKQEQENKDDIMSINLSIPDIYLQKENLENKVQQLEHELEQARRIVEKAKQTWEKLKKERDFHRMHHRRVVQEKNILVDQLKRLKNVF
ncbi:hypothetical protein RFI_12617 [Reticulomyxa filosa]|uniref:Uncharacterized protein n=1 Tax=Reticulomyxa filosa TaxID=46433 RepID=X6NGQ3_RETFI|nr:hypothetical protein RFI_12617 [Reticulomyxa filosa]|eukprot:ETO24542.1 hypothetical protein RFI_12617 [Reticulomyxa filosa]